MLQVPLDLNSFQLPVDLNTLQVPLDLNSFQLPEDLKWSVEESNTFKEEVNIFPKPLMLLLQVWHLMLLKEICLEEEF